MYLALGKSELRLITDKEAPDPVHTKAALDYLQKAVELDDKCGGRGDLNLVQNFTINLHQLRILPLKQKQTRVM